MATVPSLFEDEKFAFCVRSHGTKYNQPTTERWMCLGDGRLQAKTRDRKGSVTL